MILSDKEIRNKLLESDDPAGWKYSIGEQMRDNLTNEQAAMLAYYYYRALKYDLQYGDVISLARYFMEIMGPVIEKTMDNEIEKYKEKHDITYGQDDCSSYKEHRDLTEE